MSAAQFHPVLGMIDAEPEVEAKPVFHPVHGHGEKP